MLEHLPSTQGPEFKPQNAKKESMGKGLGAKISRTALTNTHCI
jgi:hypothetical protein